MASIYDNWERLVAATLKREELRQLALLSSMSTSFNSSISASFNISPYNYSQSITLLDYVPGLLTDRVIKAAESAVTFKQECAEIKFKIEQLAGLLQQASLVSPESYDRPMRRIISDTKLVLEKALALVLRCSRQGIKRFFKIIPADAFQKMSSQLENTIQDVSWLLSISAPSDDDEEENLRFSPITINEPILCLVWEQITTLYVGSDDDRSDAAASLASLARGNDRHGKLIVEEGGVGPLLKLVEEGSLEGQENAARAIGWLGRDPESVEHMIGAGVCKVFVKILEQGPMKVQAAVAWSVSELAMHYPNCQNLFAQHDIIPLLVAHLAFETVHDVVTGNITREMEYPITKVHMKEMAARALCQLAKGNSLICISIVESGALPCFEVLLEEGSEKAHYNFAVALMTEITAMVDQDGELRGSALNPTSLAYKSLVVQLFSLLEKTDSKLILIPCIKAIGNLARTFKAETRMISPLVKLLDETGPGGLLTGAEVCREVCIALTKFACPENALCLDHSKAIIGAGGATHLVRLLFFAEDIVKSCALILVCYLTVHVSESEQLEQLSRLDILTVLRWGWKQSILSEAGGVEKLLPVARARMELYQSRQL